MTSLEPPEGFHVVGFGPDGSQLGSAFLRIRSLSPKWLESALAFLEDHGNRFRASWGRELEAFETQLTANATSALSTFYVDGTIASSHLYLCGRDKKAEEELTSLFIDSLRKASPVQAQASSSEPFEEIRQLRERPLDVVVIWAPDSVSEERLEMAGELSTHFAAAFFIACFFA